MLRSYKTCNQMVGFSKNEFNNNLLDGVTFFRVTSDKTRTQPYISYFDMNFDKSTIKLHYFHIFSCLQNFKVIKD